VGLVFISWLGSYPEASKHAGNLCLLSTGWSIVVLAAFSALVMWLAVNMRLPTERVIEHLGEPNVEMEDENLPSP
jgi:hypothetical protein